MTTGTGCAIAQVDAVTTAGNVGTCVTFGTVGHRSTPLRRRSLKTTGTVIMTRCRRTGAVTVAGSPSRGVGHAGNFNRAVDMGIAIVADSAGSAVGDVFGVAAGSDG